MISISVGQESEQELFPRAAAIKYYKLGGLQQQKYILS